MRFFVCTIVFLLFCFFSAKLWSNAGLIKVVAGIVASRFLHQCQENMMYSSANLHSFSMYTMYKCGKNDRMQMQTFALEKSQLSIGVMLIYKV